MEVPDLDLRPPLFLESEDEVPYYFTTGTGDIPG
jgi:hypothetical protein